MFESVFSGLLNSALKQFFQPLNKQSLNISFWKGSVSLKDLEFRKECLDDMIMPFKMKAGYIGSLNIDIPWNALRSKPLVVNVDKVYIVLETTDYFNTSEESRFSGEQMAKQAQVAAMEMTRRALAQMQQQQQGQSHQSPASPEQNREWFFIKMLADLVGNIQLHVHSVHVKIEIAPSISGSAMGVNTLGISFNHLSMVSTKDDWVETTYYYSQGTVFKLIHMNGFALYWDCNTSPINATSKAELLSIFEKGISKDTNNINEQQQQDGDSAYQDADGDLFFVPDEEEEATEDVSSNNDSNNSNSKSSEETFHQHLLEPVDFDVRIMLHRVPPAARSDPRIKCHVMFPEFSLKMDARQIGGLVGFLDWIYPMTIRMNHARFRPNVSVHTSPRDWWAYGINATLKQLEDERRKKKGSLLSWKWDRMQQHCEHRRSYLRLYAHCTAGTLTPQERSELQQLEQILSAEDIVFFRYLSEKTTSLLKPSGAWKWYTASLRSWLWMGGGGGGGYNATNLTIEEEEALEALLLDPTEFMSNASDAAPPKTEIVVSMRELKVTLTMPPMNDDIRAASASVELIVCEISQFILAVNIVNAKVCINGDIDHIAVRECLSHPDIHNFIIQNTGGLLSLGAKRIQSQYTTKLGVEIDGLMLGLTVELQPMTVVLPPCLIPGFIHFASHVQMPQVLFEPYYLKSINALPRACDRIEEKRKYLQVHRFDTHSHIVVNGPLVVAVPAAMTSDQSNADYLVLEVDAVKVNTDPALDIDFVGPECEIPEGLYGRSKLSLTGVKAFWGQPWYSSIVFLRQSDFLLAPLDVSIISKQNFLATDETLPQTASCISLTTALTLGINISTLSKFTNLIKNFQSVIPKGTSASPSLPSLPSPSPFASHLVSQSRIEFSSGFSFDIRSNSNALSQESCFKWQNRASFSVGKILVDLTQFSNGMKAAVAVANAQMILMADKSIVVPVLSLVSTSSSSNAVSVSADVCDSTVSASVNLGSIDVFANPKVLDCALHLAIDAVTCVQPCIHQLTAMFPPAASTLPPPPSTLPPPPSSSPPPPPQLDVLVLLDNFTVLVGDHHHHLSSAEFKLEKIGISVAGSQVHVGVKGVIFRALERDRLQSHDANVLPLSCWNLLQVVNAGASEEKAFDITLLITENQVNCSATIAGLTVRLKSHAVETLAHAAMANAAVCMTLAPKLMSVLPKTDPVVTSPPSSAPPNMQLAIKLTHFGVEWFCDHELPSIAIRFASSEASITTLTLEEERDEKEEENHQRIDISFVLTALNVQTLSGEDSFDALVQIPSVFTSVSLIKDASSLLAIPDSRISIEDIEIVASQKRIAAIAEGAQSLVRVGSTLTQLAASSARCNDQDIADSDSDSSLSQSSSASIMQSDVSTAHHHHNDPSPPFNLAEVFAAAILYKDQHTPIVLAAFPLLFCANIDNFSVSLEHLDENDNDNVSTNILHLGLGNIATNISADSDGNAIKCAATVGSLVLGFGENHSSPSVASRNERFVTLELVQLHHSNNHHNSPHQTISVQLSPVAATVDLDVISSILPSLVKVLTFSAESFAAIVVPPADQPLPTVSIKQKSNNSNNMKTSPYAFLQEILLDVASVDVVVTSEMHLNAAVLGFGASLSGSITRRAIDGSETIDITISQKPLTLRSKFDEQHGVIVSELDVGIECNRDANETCWRLQVNMPLPLQAEISFREWKFVMDLLHWVQKEVMGDQPTTAVKVGKGTGGSSVLLDGHSTWSPTSPISPICTQNGSNVDDADSSSEPKDILLLVHSYVGSIHITLSSIRLLYAQYLHHRRLPSLAAEVSNVEMIAGHHHHHHHHHLHHQQQHLKWFAQSPVLSPSLAGESLATLFEVSSSIQVKASYLNRAVAAWEPLVEPWPITVLCKVGQTMRSSEWMNIHLDAPKVLDTSVSTALLQNIATSIDIWKQNLHQQQQQTNALHPVSTARPFPGNWESIRVRNDLACCVLVSSASHRIGPGETLAFTASALQLDQQRNRDANKSDALQPLFGSCVVHVQPSDQPETTIHVDLDATGPHLTSLPSSLSSSSSSSSASLDDRDHNIITEVHVVDGGLGRLLVIRSRVLLKNLTQLPLALKLSSQWIRSLEPGAMISVPTTLNNQLIVAPSSHAGPGVSNWTETVAIGLNRRNWGGKSSELLTFRQPLEADSFDNRGGAYAVLHWNDDGPSIVGCIMPLFVVENLLCSTLQYRLTPHPAIKAMDAPDTRLSGSGLRLRSGDKRDEYEMDARTGVWMSLRMIGTKWSSPVSIFAGNESLLTSPSLSTFNVTTPQPIRIRIPDADSAVWITVRISTVLCEHSSNPQCKISIFSDYWAINRSQYPLEVRFIPEKKNNDGSSKGTFLRPHPIVKKQQPFLSSASSVISEPNRITEMLPSSSYSIQTPVTCHSRGLLEILEFSTTPEISDISLAMMMMAAPPVPPPLSAIAAYSEQKIDNSMSFSPAAAAAAVMTGTSPSEEALASNAIPIQATLLSLTSETGRPPPQWYAQLRVSGDSISSWSQPFPLSAVGKVVQTVSVPISKSGFYNRNFETPSISVNVALDDAQGQYCCTRTMVLAPAVVITNLTAFPLSVTQSGQQGGATESMLLLGSGDRFDMDMDVGVGVGGRGSMLDGDGSDAYSASKYSTTSSMGWFGRSNNPNLVDNSTTCFSSPPQINAGEKAQCVEWQWPNPLGPHLLCVKPHGPGWSWSGDLPVQDEGEYHVMLSNHRFGQRKLIQVSCTRVSSLETISITLKPMPMHKAPYRVENISAQVLHIYQWTTDSGNKKGQRVRARPHTVRAMQCMGYAWDNPGDGDDSLLEIVVPETSPLLSGKFNPNRVGQLGFLGQYLSVEVICDDDVLCLKVRDIRSFGDNQQLQHSSRKQGAAPSIALETISDFEFSSNFAGFGLSIVESTPSLPRELIYVAVGSLQSQISVFPSRIAVSASIQSIQVDNGIGSSPFPVMFCPSAAAAATTSSRQLCFELVKSRRTGSFLFLENLWLHFGGTVIAVDEEAVLVIWNALSPTVNNLIASISGKTNYGSNIYSSYALMAASLTQQHHGTFATLQQQQQQQQQCSATLISERDLLMFTVAGLDITADDFIHASPSSAALLKPVYLQRLQISPIDISMSYRSRAIASSTSFHSWIRSLRAHVANIANMEDVPLHLPNFLLEIFHAPLFALVRPLALFYSGHALPQLYRLLGSMDVFGDPLGLWEDVRHGVHDLVAHPAKGLRNLGHDFGRTFGLGLATGTNSFVLHLVHGFAKSTSKMARSGSRMFAMMSMDPAFAASLGRRNQFVKDTVGGALGLVKRPFVEMKQNGLIGLLHGTTAGIAGVLTKPIALALVTVSQTANHIRKRTDQRGRKREKSRPTRFLWPNRGMGGYDAVLARGNEMYKVLFGESSHNGEALKVCYSLAEDGMLLVTSQRLILIHSNSPVMDVLESETLIQALAEDCTVHILAFDPSKSLSVAVMDVATTNAMVAVSIVEAVEDLIVESGRRRRCDQGILYGTDIKDDENMFTTISVDDEQNLLQAQENKRLLKYMERGDVFAWDPSQRQSIYF